MGHIMDTHANRFGWRYWHLDDAGSRLTSPIVKRDMRVGRSFFEPICPHSADFGCQCGIYYMPDPEFLLSIEDDTAGGGPAERRYSAITFGVGTGNIEVDDALPGDALHADRYHVLAIGLYENSSAAHSLRERYGVKVTQGEVTLAALREVQQRVRADLRGEDVDSYLARLEQEPALPLTDHIIDANPKFFGFRCWMLTDLGGLTTPDGQSQPGRLLPLGVTYTPSVPYARTLAHHLEASLGPDATDVPLAVTYGYASGDIQCSADEWTCDTKLYTPLAACVHRTRAHMARLVGHRYGIGVRTTIDNNALRAIEREGRQRVSACGIEILQITLDQIRAALSTPSLGA